MSSAAAQERKVFIWLDDAGEVHVSLAHQTERELRDSYDMDLDGGIVLNEFPLKLPEIEKSEKVLGRYYRALDGLLALPDMETIVELLMAAMVREGVSLAAQVPKKKAIVH